MNDDTADVDRLFARLSAEDPHRDPDDHPAPEKLSAYLANELSPEEDNDLQEHLAHCTLCTELLLDLQRFLDPPAEDLPREGVADFETAAGWRELKGRMGAGAKKGSELPGRAASLKAAYGLAAVLAVAVAGLGVYSLHLRSELLTPQGAIPLSLNPQFKERGEESVKKIDLPAQDKVISLWLIVDSDPQYPAYQATIRRVVTKEVIAVRALDIPKEGFALLLHSGSLALGEYEISVEGLGKGKPQQVGLYSFKATH